jgi:acetyltransferase-like isoleucine patch superfamily enzyme
MSFTISQRFRNKIKLKGSSIITIAKSAKIVDCSILIRGENNTLTIGKNTRLRQVNIEIIGNNCSLEIGADCMIGDKSYFSVKEGTKLILGDDCGLSRNVKVMTSDGHPIFKAKERINKAKDIIFGSHIWIADNVTILKGVSIGSGAVIGINSTVTKDIPKSVIAVGNPARVVQEGIEWRDKL